MLTPTRREFVAGLTAFAVAPFQRGTEPELLLLNGNVMTMDPLLPRAEALAIAGGRLAAIGTTAEISRLAAGSARKVDLGGRTVVPGFVDAHAHPASAGLSHLRSVDADLRSIAAIQQALRERATKTPKGEWVTAFKYDDTKTSDGRRLTRKDLDEAVPDHPVAVAHRGGHTLYVNSLALARAKITKDATDPVGGRFDRDPQTRDLTGRLEETAADLVERLIPSTITPGDRRAGVKLISEMMSRAGITTVHDAYGSPNDLVAYQDARDAGELRVRIYSLIGHFHLEKMLAAGVRTGFGDEWVRVGPIKMTCDGSISERTARLSQPYVGRPNDYGIIVTDKTALYEKARKAHENGWQIGIHANGDVAIGMTLDVYEQLAKDVPRRDPRFRIEHCTVVDEELVARMKRLGVIPNPFGTYVYYHGDKMREYGPERLQRMFALRSFLDAGLKPTMTSDYPPGPFEPMMALQSMVTRTDMQGTTWGANQKITVEEAIRIGTMHGAYASFEENVKGSLTPGKCADLVVLGRDPMNTPAHELINIPVERTMAGGRWMWES
jgi:predicted amidohydrolase YtcJ